MGISGDYEWSADISTPSILGYVRTARMSAIKWEEFSHAHIYKFLQKAIPEKVKRVLQLEKQIAVVNYYWSQYYMKLDVARNEGTTRMEAYEHDIENAILNGEPQVAINRLKVRRKNHIESCSFQNLRNTVTEDIARSMGATRAPTVTLRNKDSALYLTESLRKYLPDDDVVVVCGKKMIIQLLGVKDIDGSRTDGWIHELTNYDPDIGCHHKEIITLVDELRYLTSFEAKMSKSHARRMQQGKSEKKYKIMNKYMNKGMLPDFNESDVDEADLFWSEEESQNEETDAEGNDCSSERMEDGEADSGEDESDDESEDMDEGEW